MTAAALDRNLQDLNQASHFSTAESISSSEAQHNLQSFAPYKSFNNSHEKVSETSSNSSVGSNYSYNSHQNVQGISSSKNHQAYSSSTSGNYKGYANAKNSQRRGSGHGGTNGGSGGSRHSYYQGLKPLFVSNNKLHELQLQAMANLYFKKIQF